MKKAALSCLMICFFISCRSGGDRADVITEDGVEVVLNHLQPYALRGEPASLELTRLFSIDTEKDSTAALGLTDIYAFDVDFTGAIYAVRPPVSPGDLVFKFSGTGEFITSFGRLGQGPYEMEYPDQILATGRGEVWIMEGPKHKYHIFGDAGKPLAEKIMYPNLDAVIPLENGNFLANGIIADDMTLKYLPLFISLYDSNLQKIKDLDRFLSYPNKVLAASFPGKIVNGIEHVFCGAAFGDRIYIGNSERGYEIPVYDLGGGLIRKIRKEYTPVPVSDEYKRDYLKMFEQAMPDYTKKIFFPDNWHPFRNFFCDDDGRLFVMTYEPGANPGEYIFDVFNKDGRFFARKSLNIYFLGNTLMVRARGSRLTCVQEKKSGFKEIVAYEMAWR